mgnify:CR=1 FL=1
MTFTGSILFIWSFCSFLQTERLHDTRGNSLTCPECRTLSKGSPDSFKVCRLAKALQEALHGSKGTGMLRSVQADQCENRLDCEVTLR